MRKRTGRAKFFRSSRKTRIGWANFQHSTATSQSSKRNRPSQFVNSNGVRERSFRKWKRFTCKVAQTKDYFNRDTD